MNLNLGIYGVPHKLSLAVAEAEADGQERPAAELFPTVTKVRELEAFVRSVGGFQHTYCDSFQVRRLSQLQLSLLRDFGA